MCGVTAEPGFVEVNRWMRAMPQYTLGHLERLNQIEAALSRYGGLILTGAGYRGVGIPDCIRDGTVAAERVMRYLSGERS
jgi:oxygen-dependent protoporphyrinogen oxidase